MNQILLTKDKQGAKVTAMKPIIKFFCVVAIIFALILLGEGSYNLYSSLSKNSYPVPVLTPEKNGSDMKIKISSEIGISKILYFWNDGEQMEYKGEGKTTINFEIAIPQGKNTLNISVIDIQGNKTKYEGIPVEFSGTEDTKKPRISIENKDDKLIITATDETELDYLTYQWEGGEVVEIKPTKENNKTIKQEIKTQKGDKKLTMIAVDKAGNKETVSKTITSNSSNTTEPTASTTPTAQTTPTGNVTDTTKPKISIENASGKLIITATDETELNYLTYQWENGEEIKTVATEEDKKTVKLQIDVEKGTKNLTLTAVDKAGNKEVVNKKIVGSNGPQISVTISEGNFVVKVTDEYKITKIQYTLNDEEFTVDNIPQNSKEYEFRIPLKAGVTNYLKINAYENNLMTEYKCKKTN